MKTFLILVVVMSILGLVAFLLGALSSREETPGQQQTQTPSPPVPKPLASKVILPSTLYNITGTIRSIEGQRIVFEAKIPQVDEENNRIVYTVETKIVKVGATTKITRQRFVPIEGTNQKRSQETEISLSDLKEGNVIEVLSNREVRDAGEITATKIRILPGG